MPDKSIITLGDRIAAAWVAFMAAALTLLLLPLAICIFSGAVSAKGASLFVHYYGYVFSKHGLFLLLGETRAERKPKRLIHPLSYRVATCRSHDGNSATTSLPAAPSSTAKVGDFGEDCLSA